MNRALEYLALAFALAFGIGAPIVTSEYVARDIDSRADYVVSIEQTFVLNQQAVAIGDSMIAHSGNALTALGYDVVARSGRRCDNIASAVELSLSLDHRYDFALVWAGTAHLMRNGHDVPEAAESLSNLIALVRSRSDMVIVLGPVPVPPVTPRDARELTDRCVAAIGANVTVVPMVDVYESLPSNAFLPDGHLSDVGYSQLIDMGIVPSQYKPNA